MTVVAAPAAGPATGTRMTALPSRWVWLAPTAVFAVVFAAFSPSFGAWFMSLDFNHLAAIRETDAATFFARIFDPSDGGRTVFNTGDLYRPVYYTAFWLEYQVFGLRPLPYYVTNALLHATNAVLVWLLARRLTGSAVAATAAALIWALHPQYADAVAWISSITDLLLVFFSLTAVLLYARAMEETGGRHRLLVGASFVATLLALGAKEPGIAVVPVIVVYHVLIGRPVSLRRPELPASLLPFLIIPVVYFPLRALLVGNLAYSGSTELDWQVFQNIEALTGLALSPLANVDFRASPIGTPERWAAWGAIAVTLAVAALGTLRQRFLVWWYYVTLLPFAALLPILIIGRYLYLPFVALAILAGAAIAQLGRRLPERAPLRTALPFAVAAGLGLWLITPNLQHQDELNIQGDEAQRFIAELRAVYPELEDGTRLIVGEFPEALSLAPDDGFMLEPAVRLAYQADVEVVTRTELLVELSEGTVPAAAVNAVYPPGAVLPGWACAALGTHTSATCR